MGDRTAMFDPAAHAQGPESARGSKDLRRYAVLGSTMGGGAVLAVAINKLTAEQIVYLLERAGEKGSTFILALVALAILYRVGMRIASAAHKMANEMGIFAGASSVMSVQVTKIAGSVEGLSQEAARLEGIEGSLASLHAKVDTLRAELRAN